MGGRGRAVIRGRGAAAQDVERAQLQGAGASLGRGLMLGFGRRSEGAREGQVWLVGATRLREEEKEGERQQGSFSCGKG